MRLTAVLLLWQSASISAFVVVPQTTTTTSRPTPAKSLANLKVAGLFMSSSPEDGEDNPDKERTSFDDAGRSLIEEEDNEKMDAMGDFDSNPASTDNIEKMRAAIRARAQDLGVEKSKVSQQYIEDARKRAQEAIGDKRQGGLDLSQISTGNEPGSKSKWDEDLPTMMYDPADELTDEEQAEADTVGTLPFLDQAMTEIKASKFPGVGSVIREIAVMFVVVAATGAFIIGADRTLRDFYTNLGMIPRKEDIPGQLDDLDLPEGFTNNMNEDDLAKLTQEMNSVSKSPGSSSSPSVKALLDSKNPDL